MSFGAAKGWVLAAIIMACIFAPRSLSFLPLVPGLIGYIVLSWQARKPFPLDKHLAILFAGITILSALSALWSVDPQETLERTVNTGGILLGGLVLFSFAKAQDIRRTAGLYALLILYILTGLYIYFEYKSNMALSTIILGEPVNIWNFNRTITVYMVLLVPMIVMASRIMADRQRAFVTAVILLICAGLPFWQTSSQTAQLTVLLGLMAYGSLLLLKGQRLRKFIMIASAVMLCALTLASPLIPGPVMTMVDKGPSDSNISYSANAPGRVEIWNFVASFIHENPLLGHGVEATRSLESPTVLPYNRVTSFLHPHNAYLQVWVEMGVPGAILACIAIVFILRRIYAAHPEDQPLYYGVFISLAALLSTGYGLWQSWQLGLLLASAALCLLLTRIQKP